MSNNPALAGNISMLRTVALQIEIAVAKNDTLPAYLKESAMGFVNAIRKFISEETEPKANDNSTKSAS